MILVREATVMEWKILRDTRLAALRDAPDAFLSTYAEQVTLGETDWRLTIARGGTFLAYIPEVNVTGPVGLVGGCREEQDIVELVSMWVCPKARGCGIGEALIAAVIGWADARNATSVHLWVMETNKYARMLYERCGFSPTDERQPLPSNLDLTEVGMIRRL